MNTLLMKKYLDKKILIKTSYKERIIGKLIAFDNHLNLVVVDAEKWDLKDSIKDNVKILKQINVKKLAGLVILRGDLLSYLYEID
mmetsp:Transcript_9014/g.14232  ORF Transcript_9014/g.14232 Transcript_9014/m.14232 type:complete len:85 (+) Transcript_9014:22-276(+)